MNQSVTHIKSWYDPHTRSWITQALNSQGEQIAVQYDETSEGMERSRKAMCKQNDLYYKPYDPQTHFPHPAERFKSGAGHSPITNSRRLFPSEIRTIKYFIRFSLDDRKKGCAATADVWLCAAGLVALNAYNPSRI